MQVVEDVEPKPVDVKPDVFLFFSLVKKESEARPLHKGKRLLID